MAVLENWNQVNNQNGKLIQTFRLYPTLDKIKVAEKIGVSSPTLYKAIEELKVKGVLNENAKINQCFGSFIGISIGTSVCKVVFLHFDFTQYSSEEFEKFRLNILNLLDDEIRAYNLTEERNYIYFNTPDNFSTLKHYLNCVLEGIKAFIQEKSLDVLSVGISSTGTIDIENQAICQAHNLEYLEDRYIKDFIYPENIDFFKDQNISFCLVQNGTAAVIAEKFKLYETADMCQLCNRNNIATIYLEYGISAGFIFNGRLFFGSNGHSGEIGHISIPNDLLREMADEDKLTKFHKESKCTCGSIDCIDHVFRYFVFSTNEEKDKEFFKKMRSDQIADYLNEYPDRAICLGKILGYITNLLTMVLNVDLVVFTGKLYKSIPLLEKTIQAKLDDNRLKYNRSDCKIYKSEIGTLAPAIGAAIYSYYQSCKIDIDWN